MKVRIIIYASLCAVMVIAKTGASGIASGNGNDLLANLLGLVLLLPWVVVMPILFDKVSINSTEWFFGFACLNIFLWTVYEYWKSYRLKRKQSQ